MSKSDVIPTQRRSKRKRPGEDLDHCDSSLGYVLPPDRWVREMRERQARGESRERLFGPDRPSPYYMLEIDGIRLIGYWANDRHRFTVIAVETLDADGRRQRRLNRHRLRLRFENTAEADLWCAEIIDQFRPRSECEPLDRDGVDKVSLPQRILALCKRVEARRRTRARRSCPKAARQQRRKKE